MKTFAFLSILMAVTAVNAVALTPANSLHPLNARCHCDGHCCGGGWCNDEGTGECVGDVPYCDGVPCPWA
ncbi:hypothetical protein TruAng_006188 [Truncatella angustata]|nr:hypothetical protein TruAng_006188 [Truncatella angustata]